MKINVDMKRELKHVSKIPKLCKPLSVLLKQGFFVRNGCYFIRNLYTPVVGAQLKMLWNDIARECFVNSIHVEDYESRYPLSQALSYIEKAFESFSDLRINLTLVAVMSCDKASGSVVVKFHVKRDGVSRLDDDLEGYIQPVLTIDSSEDVSHLLLESRF